MYKINISNMLLSPSTDALQSRNDLHLEVAKLGGDRTIRLAHITQLMELNANTRWIKTGLMNGGGNKRLPVHIGADSNVAKIYCVAVACL